jgi:hypothetical protein
MKKFRKERNTCYLLILSEFCKTLNTVKGIVAGYPCNMVENLVTVADGICIDSLSLTELSAT